MSTGAASQTGSDFAVIGLVHAFVLFVLIIAFGQVSGGHFNPAVTIAAAAMKRIDPVDAVVYILAQLSGAVLGALLVKGMLLDEGRADRLRSGDDQPAARRPVRGVRGRGDRHLPARARGLRGRDEPARPPGVGAVRDRHHAGLRGDDLRPADRRLVQPGALVRPGADRRRFDGFSDVWPYIVGPIVGALLAVAVYRFVIAGPQYAEGAEPPTSDVRGVAQAVKDAEVREREQVASPLAARLSAAERPRGELR